MFKKRVDLTENHNSLEIYFSFSPILLFLGIYPKELIIQVQAELSTRIITAVLFKVIQNWKIRRCRVIEDW